MEEHSIRLGEGGRVIIPAVYRKALGINIGDELVLRMEQGELRLFQQSNALERIRAAVKRARKKAGRMDDFLAFRKQDGAL